MAVANLGIPRPYATFALSCAYASSGLTDEKLFALDRLVRHFVPKLSIFFMEQEKTGASRCEAAVCQIEQELQTEEIIDAIGHLDPPQHFS